MSGSDFTPQALKIMRARSGGRCEGCGKVGLLQAHHVCYRSRGGDGGAGNGLLLCGSGNASGCHGIAHTGEGAERGWSASSYSETRRPVHHARFGLVLITDEGRVVAADGFACWPHSAEFPKGRAGCRECVPVGRVLWVFEEEKGWAA